MYDREIALQLDNRWLEIAPLPYWKGTCVVTVDITDSIRLGSDDFYVNVVEATYIALPVLYLMSSS